MSKNSKQVQNFRAQVTPIVKERAGRTTTRLFRTAYEPLKFYFHSQGHEPWSEGSWTPRISVKPKAKRQGRIWLLDISVFCNCPYFQYYGPFYNNKHKDDLAPESKGIDLPPVIRDPNHENFLCKHLKSAIDLLVSQPVRVLKAMETEWEKEDAGNEIPEAGEYGETYKPTPQEVRRIRKPLRAPTPTQELYQPMDTGETYRKTPEQEKSIRRLMTPKMRAPKPVEKVYNEEEEQEPENYFKQIKKKTSVDEETMDEFILSQLL